MPQRPSTLQRQTDAFRAKVLAMESESTRLLSQTYADALTVLEPRILALSKQIEEARANGDEPNLSWLFQQERYQELRRQLLTLMDQYGEATKLITTEAQKVIVRESLQHAGKTLLSVSGGSGDEIATLARGWASVPDESIINLVGAMQSGTPLDATIQSYGVDAVQDVQQALTRGLALGDSAQMTTQTLRALGVTRARAESLVRTETMRAARAATTAAYVQSGVVKKVRWSASLSSRTCFPAGTMITTIHGDRPIEQIVDGDMVLTHRGRFRRVHSAYTRKHAGQFTTITAGDFAVVSTSDHPVLVERGGVLDWVEAGDIRTGDRVFADRQSSIHESNHFIGQLFGVERLGGQAKHADADRLQMSVFPCVALSRSSVPVRRVDLNHDVAMWQEEVNGLTKAGDFVLLLESLAQTLQRKTRILFRKGFARKRAITLSTAEATNAVDLGRLGPERLSTVQAFHHVRRAPTFFGAVAQPALLRVEQLPATRTRSDQCDAIGAFRRTERARRTPKWGEGLSAFGAGLLPVSMVTLLGANIAGDAARCITSGVDSEFVTAHSASTPISWGIGYSAYPMWMPRLIGEVAGLAAKFALALLELWRCSVERVSAFQAGSVGFGLFSAPGKRTETIHRAELAAPAFDGAGMSEEWGTAFKASAFHPLIVANVAHHSMRTTIHNFTVDEDHSYVANGLVVHNCGYCLSRHGKLFPVDYVMQTHPCCRCSLSPWAPAWDEPWQSGESWLKEQPLTVQQDILGKLGAADFRAGNLQLSDFEKTGFDKEWGPTGHFGGVEWARKQATKAGRAPSEWATAPPITRTVTKPKKAPKKAAAPASRPAPARGRDLAGEAFVEFMLDV